MSGCKWLIGLQERRCKLSNAASAVFQFISRIITVATTTTTIALCCLSSYAIIWHVGWRFVENVTAVQRLFFSYFHFYDILLCKTVQQTFVMAHLTVICRTMFLLKQHWNCFLKMRKHWHIAQRCGMPFCAPWKRDYHFSCFLCGNHPKIIVGDGNWKNTCQLPGWELHDVA